jgi:phosphatidate cytidylyltransferase
MKRILTAAIGIPLVAAATLYAPNWLFALIVAAVSAVALEEFLNLFATKERARPGKWFLLPGALVTASFAWGLSNAAVGVILAALVLMVGAAFSNPLEGALEKVAGGLAGVTYCCLLTGSILLLSRNWILVLFAIVWVGDSAAYYCGRLFGKHLLAPQLSPRKTVEGAVAGLIGSIAGGIIMSSWLIGEPWQVAGLLSGVAGLAGQVGDLCESALKRSAHVKDSSSILPGHGGILDRLDSLLFAAPVLYCMLQIT